MILLPLAWALLTASLWKSGSSQTLLEDPITERYPEIHSNETIDCDCVHSHCDFVYWFYSNLNTGKVQFLGKCNNADRDIYGPDVKKGHFKIQKRGGMSFVLRIIDVTEADAGIYSCVLKDKSQNELWKPGVFLRPGVTPPTPPPKIKPKPRPSFCRCPAKNPPDGCGSMILWPLVGLVASLALALICTLYYFSR
uniref:Cd8 beta n=1 Tax=Amphiprion percula TaxID=161767 RepID=A0A3P8RTV0_AMPPE